MTEVDVVVAGAGVAGSALAYELGRRGLHAVVLERGAQGPTGASTVPAALINPHRGRTARATPNDLAGADAFWRMVQDLEAEVGSSGAHRTGVLRLADNARQARAWQRLQGTHWLESGEVPPHYHAPFGGLVVPSGGWLLPDRLLRQLVTAAQARSVKVWWGSELVGVAAAPSQLGPAAPGATSTPRLHARLRRPELGAGEERVACRAVVVATGARQPAEIRLPSLELVWGEAYVLEMGSTPTLPLAGGVIAAFQDGQAMVSGGHRPAGLLGQPETAAAPTRVTPDLVRALAWRVPAAASARVVQRWEGVRAKRPSGEPVIRRLGPGVYLMAAFGGRGFLRAATAAARLADELAERLA